MKDLHIVRKSILQVLTPDLREQVNRMHGRYALWESGCILTNDDHGPWGTPELMPRVDFSRRRVYTGQGDAGTYNHHSAITKFNGRYVLAWSNGIVDESTSGQRILLSWSDDAQDWSTAQCIVPGDVAANIMRQVAGLMPWDEKLVLYYVTRECILDPTQAGGRHYKDGAFSLDACVTSDGENWETYSGLVTGNVWMFEEPRLTQAGTWLAAGTVAGPVVYRWPKNDPLGEPEIIALQQSDEEGVFPAGEASWYQTDEERIWMYWRDEAGSLRLYVSVSDDDGQTWTGPLLSDFPDSVSRVRAGRLPDGRYYLIGNSYPHLYNRIHLMISISDDGAKFHTMYTLVGDPTAQRVKGLLKNHGYQYPNDVIDGDKMLVSYSVNKEDIECGIVDTTTL